MGFSGKFLDRIIFIEWVKKGIFNIDILAPAWQMYLFAYHGLIVI